MQTSYNQEPLLQFIITKFIIQKANLKELLDNHVLCTITAHTLPRSRRNRCVSSFSRATSLARFLSVVLISVSRLDISRRSFDI